MTDNDDTQPTSVVFSCRIHPQALEVLEWHARLTGTPLRRRIRDLLETEAATITETFNLRDTGPPTTRANPAFGTFQPSTRTIRRNTQ